MLVPLGTMVTLKVTIKSMTRGSVTRHSADSEHFTHSFAINGHVLFCISVFCSGEPRELCT